jgi:hypothetical protein
MLRTISPLPFRTLASTFRAAFSMASRRSYANPSPPLHDLSSSSPEPTARELISAKARAFELKYQDKLKKKVEE